MVIGLLTLELFFPDSHALKAKRSLAVPLLQELRRQWNVSAAEIARQDAWQRATFAVASVNTAPAEAHRTLTEVVRHVEAARGVQLVDFSIEIL
jgi:uncharacterized protein YlxP (DUF503 family)